MGFYESFISKGRNSVRLWQILSNRNLAFAEISVLSFEDSMNLIRKLPIQPTASDSSPMKRERYFFEILFFFEEYLIGRPTKNIC